MLFCKLKLTFWEVYTLGVDLLRVDILRVDILGRTPEMFIANRRLCAKMCDFVWGYIRYLWDTSGPAVLSLHPDDMRCGIHLRSCPILL